MNEKINKENNWIESNKNYKEELWDIIEESKENANFNPQTQFENLCDILKRHSKDELKSLHKEWEDINSFYRHHNNGEYEKLHWSKGGIIHSGDSTFNMDFSSWLIAQGRELYESFKENGIIAILSYIINNNIQEDMYEYESMEYIWNIEDETLENNIDLNNKEDIRKTLNYLKQEIERIENLLE